MLENFDAFSVFSAVVFVLITAGLFATLGKKKDEPAMSGKTIPSFVVGVIKATGICSSILVRLNISCTYIACLNKATEFKPFRLSRIESVSHNTKKFTFSLATPETRLGLPVGQHITLRFGKS